MTAPVGIKRLALAVIAVVLVGFGAVLVLPFLMPADAVRDAVKAEIYAVTGLDPVLQGRASVALFPAGRVSFDDVTLGDNRTGAPALTAERVVARLRFFPILIGRIEIADVSLVRPTIAIVSKLIAARTGPVISKPWRATSSVSPIRQPPSQRFASRTAPSSCATRQTTWLRRFRMWSSRLPGPPSHAALRRPAGLSGVTSRWRPASA